MLESRSLNSQTRRVRLAERSESVLANPLGGCLARLVTTGALVAALLHTSLIVGYFALRLLTGDDLWIVDAMSYGLPWLFTPLVVLLPAALLRRSRAMIGLVSIPTILFLVTYGPSFLPRPSIRTPVESFTVMTYNVLFENLRAADVAEAIRAHSPDIVGLHELEEPMARSLEKQLEAEYPYRRFEPSRGLLSRVPILGCEAYRLGQGQGHWAQECELDVNGSRLSLLNLHIRAPVLSKIGVSWRPRMISAPFSAHGRDADLRDVIARVDRIAGPLVVIGDFNTSDQHSLYKALSVRLDDAHAAGGRGMGFSFTPSLRSGIATWRIDYVFHTQDLVALQVKTGDYGGSDHRPVIATLGFRNSERGS